MIKKRYPAGHRVEQAVAGQIGNSVDARLGGAGTIEAIPDSRREHVKASDDTWNRKNGQPRPDEG